MYYHEWVSGIFDHLNSEGKVIGGRPGVHGDKRPEHGIASIDVDIDMEHAAQFIIRLNETYHNIQIIHAGDNWVTLNINATIPSNVVMP